MLDVSFLAWFLISINFLWSSVPERDGQRYCNAVCLSDCAHKLKSTNLLFYLFGVLRRFQHCTGHITTGSWKGRGNQYIQFVKILTSKYQLSHLRLCRESNSGIRGGRRECYHSATVVPLKRGLDFSHPACLYFCLQNTKHQNVLGVLLTSLNCRIAER